MEDTKQGNAQMDFINVIAVVSVAILGIVMLFQGSESAGSVLTIVYGISFVCAVQIFLKEQLYKKAVFACLGIFCIWMWVSAFIAGQPLNDLFFNELACQWYVCFLGFVIGYITRSPWGKRVISLAVYLYTLVSAGIYGMIALIATGSLITGTARLPQVGAYFQNGRLTAYGNANILGQFVTVSFFTSLWICLERNEGRRRKIYRVTGLASSLICIFVLGLTRSRSAFVAVIAGLVIGLLYLLREKLPYGISLAKRLSVYAAASILLTVFMFFLFAGSKAGYDIFVNAGKELAGVESEETHISELEAYPLTYSLNNLTDRTYIWPATMMEIAESNGNLWLGCTAPLYNAREIGYVYPERPDLGAAHPHNGYLDTLRIFGIPGAGLLTCFLLFGGQAVVACFRRKKSTNIADIMIVCSGAVHGITTLSPFPGREMLVPVCLFFFLCLGGIVSDFHEICAEDTDAGKLPIKEWKSLAATGLVFAAYLMGLCYVIAANWDACYVDVWQESFCLAETDTATNTQPSGCLTPEYWLSLKQEDPSVKYMNMHTIKNRNRQNRKMISTRRKAFALQDLGEQFNGKLMVKLIKDTCWRPEDYSRYTRSGQPVTRGYFRRREKNANLDSIGEVENISFGYSLENTVLCKYPTKDKVYEIGGNPYCDEMLQAELDVYMPVAVLHESTDGKWYYVLTYGYGGWVEKSRIVLCDSREQWLSFQAPEQFLVVTGNELRVGTDTYTRHDMIRLPMGTKLALVSEDELPESVNGRDTEGNYVVGVPAAGSDGSWQEGYLLIPKTADVSEGYLTFNTDNILKQSMKFYGQIYGWAGDYDSVDCSAMTRRIYACFGASLPRSAKAQSDMNGYYRNNVSYKGEQGKIKTLEKTPAGALLYFPGHVMLYLGTVDGHPYCISAVGSVAELNEHGQYQKKYVNSVIISDLTDTYRMDGRTWLESLEIIVTP